MFLHLLRTSPWLLVAFVMLMFQSPDAGGVLLGASTTDIIEAFKYTYAQDRLSYYASEEVVLWNILSRKKEHVGGRGQWILPVQTKNTGVFVGHTEGGAKTTRRAQPDSTEATFSLQEFHGIWDISWKMLSDMKKSQDAFQRGLDFMEMSFRRRVLRLLNADLCGYGRGELGILPAADNQTSITVRALPFADLGLIVDVMDDTDDNTKLAAARTIDAIANPPTRELTISGAAIAGSAAGDYFTVADSVSVAGSLHTNGILGVIAATNPKAVVGNYGNINRALAGNEFWQALEFSNGGTLRPFTEDLGLAGTDAVRERGGTRMKKLLSNSNIARRYHEVLRGEAFFALGSAPRPFEGKIGQGRDQYEAGKEGTGRTPYIFGDMDWHIEPFFDANIILGFDPDHFFIGYGENEMPAPISEIFDDMVPFFGSTANTTFDVISYWQGELLSDQPSAGIRFNDIAES